jgi:hypothetical protein
MKVIQQGEWKQRQTCRGCSSILQVEIADIESEQKMQQDESFALVYFVVCPICETKIVQRTLSDKLKREIAFINECGSD